MPDLTTPTIEVPRHARADGLLPQKNVREVTMDVTEGRVHELALQNWFYKRFFVTEGYPIPVVFATPMDAFSMFANLWKSENNPFAYLLEAKDAEGTPLYEPYPSPVRYPLISIKKTGWTPRINQSYGIHRFRHMGYPTTSTDVAAKPGDVGGLTQRDLGNVMTSVMPTAWDFRYQIDHFCTRPDTQAVFVHKVMRNMVFAGGAMQTWIRVVYPGWFGKDHLIVRMYLDGNIDNMTPDEPSDGQVEYRTVFNLVVEGYSPDIDTTLWPTLWTKVEALHPVSIEQLNRLYTPTIRGDEDLRDHNENQVFKALPNLPPVS